MSEDIKPCRFCGEPVYNSFVGQYQCGTTAIGAFTDSESCRGYLCLRRELDKLRTQRNELRRANELLTDRAEMADRYESWLTDIGRSVGCGHIDERLPTCVEQALSEE